MKRMTALILTVLLLVCAAVPACAGQDVSEEDTALWESVEQILVLYGSRGEEAAGEIEERLRELEAKDPAAAEKWREILELWRGEGLRVNENILPDGLPETDELCLVGLGFQLNPDGSMREELIERLKVLKSCARIVCTGGGTAKDRPEATEAGEMAEWLRENGVDSARILVEDRSQTTAQNAIFTLDLLAKQAPQVTKLAIVSSDYHIATGTLLFGAEAILRGDAGIGVVSNAAWKAPSGSLPPMFQAGALIELLGDTKTAYDIYFDTYDIHELLPPRSE